MIQKQKSKIGGTMSIINRKIIFKLFILFIILLISINFMACSNRISKTITTLKYIKSIFEFNTVEYVYKYIFPYDFIDETKFDMSKLINKVSRKEELTDEEKIALKTYYLCKDIDLPISRSHGKFVVMTIIVSGGFNFENTIYENIDNIKNMEEVENYITIDDEEKTLSLLLPETEIIDIILKDESYEEYGNITIKPSQIKKISEMFDEEVKKMAVKEGILTKAKDNGKKFINDFFISLGFNKVTFIEQED